MADREQIRPVVNLRRMQYSGAENLFAFGISMPPKKHSGRPSPSGERIQKVLAAAGYGSRRACEEFIEMGRVTVDGKVVSELGARVDLTTQKVAVDGEPIRAEKKQYFLFNKPVGVLCTNNDPGNRPRVIDFFPKSATRLYPVGRLDENTEGLLLVTNDGDLAQKLTHPKYGIPRVYRAVVAGVPSQETLTQLVEGLYFTEGRFRLYNVAKLKTQGNATLLEIVMREGQNREIRRLFARVGHKVMKLKRVLFGPLKLGDLERGTARRLTPEELEKLQDVTTGRWKEPPRLSARPPTKPKRERQRPVDAVDGALGKTSSEGSSAETERPVRKRTAAPLPIPADPYRKLKPLRGRVRTEDGVPETAEKNRPRPAPRDRTKDAAPMGADRPKRAVREDGEAPRRKGAAAGRGPKKVVRDPSQPSEEIIPTRRILGGEGGTKRSAKKAARKGTSASAPRKAARRSGNAGPQKPRGRN